MYCTKCGANLPQGAARCPRCGAQPRFHSQPAAPATGRSRSSTRAVLIAVAATVAIGAVALGVDRMLPDEGTQTPRMVESSGSSAPHQAASGGISGANLMFLPNANPNFVGNWGGHLRAQGSPPVLAGVKLKVVPASFYFGERNGEVYLKTNLYGNPKWKVVKTDVKVIDPRTVQFSVDSVCKSCAPEQQQQQVTRLELVDSSHLKATVSSGAAGGGAHGELSYTGTLHPLTPDELAAIDREVERDGKFMAKVNSKVQVGN